MTAVVEPVLSNKKFLRHRRECRRVLSEACGPRDLRAKPHAAYGRRAALPTRMTELNPRQICSISGMIKAMGESDKSRQSLVDLE